MTDSDDDWMNPPTSYSWTQKQRPDGEVWLIQRQERRVVFGPSGHYTNWKVWAEFDSKEARDAQLAELRKTTKWSLRGRRGYYRHNELYVYEPVVDE